MRNLQEEYIVDKIGKKDFNGWIIVKKQLHGKAKLRAIKDGDIWWCAVGENVGSEICGKGKRVGSMESEGGLLRFGF